MATSQIPVTLTAAPCETVTTVSDRGRTELQQAKSVSSMALKSTPGKQPAAARMFPFLYIQGGPTMRVGTSSTGNAILTSTSGTVTQVMSNTNRPTGSHQYIPKLAPKLTVPQSGNVTIAPAGKMTLAPAGKATTCTNVNKSNCQPHFVIQAPRQGGVSNASSTATIVPVSVAAAGIGKHAIAYLGTIIKPNISMNNGGDGAQLMLPTGQLTTGLLPSSNQKLLLAPLPVLPLTSTPATASSTSGTTTTQSTQVASLLVPVSLGAQVKSNATGMINLKISNGQIHTEGKASITVLHEAKPLLPPLQPIGAKHHHILKPTNLKVRVSSALPDSTTLTPMPEQKSQPSIIQRKSIKLVKEDEVNLKKPNNNNSSTNNNNNNDATKAIVVKDTLEEPDKKLNHDLNRCLQEAIDAFAPGSPALNKEREKENECDAKKLMDDEVTLIKVVSTKEESVIKEKVEINVSEDDVKIELVTPEGNKSPLEPFNKNADDFDPVNVLDWKDGIGALPGSNLKFRLNEFGLMEMVDDEDSKPKCNMLPVSSDDNKSKLNDISNFVVKSEGEDEKPFVIKKECNENEDIKPVAHHEKRRNIIEPHGKDEIFCCKGCGCYGLASEFINIRFCSHACVSNHALKKAAQTKKERDLLQLKIKRRRKKLFRIMQQRLAGAKTGPPPTAPHVIKSKALLDDQPTVQLVLQSTAQPVLQPSSQSSVQASTHSTVQVQPTVIVKTPVPSEDDNNSNDALSDKTKLPWQIGKNGFSWSKYLDHCKARAAPVKLFKDPFPYQKNGFKVGMKMEGIDPEHPSYYCVLTVADFQGYRIRLHFDGYPDNHDFWVNADTMDIFPAGWCEKNNHRLQPPLGYTVANFNWGTYLKQSHAQAAPRNLFTNKTGNSVCPHGFRLGMKLEAVDRKNSSLICVATVAKLMDNRILVHFDSWDDVYDYWVEPTSPYIHPVGWCEQNGRTLTPPNHYKGIHFSWESYLKDTKALAAPARAFKQRPLNGFKRGMKLECVDKRVPMLIRVVTVDQVRDHQIKIHFDGWLDQYSYWVDDITPDIHPVGWCQKTGHQLEPPLSKPCPSLSSDETLDNVECATPGCRGLGHVKGPKYSRHQNVHSCPYALQNLNKDGFYPDRISNKPEESQEDSNLKDKRLVETRNPVGRPPKWRRMAETDEGKMSSQEPEWRLDDEDSGERKRKKRRNISEERAVSPPSKPQPAPSVPLSNSDMDQLRKELRQSVRSPGYEADPNLSTSYLWTKHSQYLNNYVSAASSNDPREWSLEEVQQFVQHIPGCEQVAPSFHYQQIDGDSFLMLTQSDLVTYMGLKLGPAIKLYNSIVLLRQKLIAS